MRTLSLIKVLFIFIKKVQYLYQCKMLSSKTKSQLINGFGKNYLGVNLFIINVKMGRCFLVAQLQAYYVHAYGCFLASVCISLPRFFKRDLKQVFKFLETHAKNGPQQTGVCMNYFYKESQRANLSGNTFVNIILSLTCFLNFHGALF